MKIFNLYSKLERYSSLDSTNMYASHLLRNKRPEEGTVILSDFQTQGKGQQGNNWVSEKGKNLTLSIILFPCFLKAELQFYISMALSLGLIGYLKKFKLPEVKIKWPNDIIVNKRKISGILIENSILKDKISNSVLGIGLNVNQENFPANIFNPTSLKKELKRELNIDSVLMELLESIEYWLTLLYKNEFEFIKESYEKELFLRNIWSAFSIYDGEIRGLISGVNEIGQLQIKKSDNTIQSFNFKEIIFHF